MIAITGIGIISSIGNNADETRRNLLDARSGISTLEFLESRYSGQLPVGEVKASNEDLRSKIEWPYKYPLTRTTLLGMIAARQTIRDAGLEDGKGLALISSTSVAGMDVSESFYKEYLIDREAADLKKIISHDCGYCTEQIGRYIGIDQYLSTISTACSSSANAILHGAEFINYGLFEKVLVGGTDALSAFTLNGFNALKIVDEKLCRPFDENRAGLNLGEGAAYLLLEKLDSAVGRGAKIYGLYAGGGNTSDAFHQTASSPDGKGAKLAMTTAMEMANVESEEVDYCNAHGTATPNNDASEGRAIEDILGKDAVFSSTKAFTGHTPGGSRQALKPLFV